MRAEKQLPLLFKPTSASTRLFRHDVPTPKGPHKSITLQWNASGLLARLDFQRPSDEAAIATEVLPANVRKLIRSLHGFFDEGTPLPAMDIDDFDQSDWSPFQRQVYAVILQIPYGETRTYGWVAEKIGQLSATRAVGQALRNNPVPILIPCHRVVGLSSLGGFMGSADPARPELGLKRTLIDLEERYLSPMFSFLVSETA